MHNYLFGLEKSFRKIFEHLPLSNMDLCTRVSQKNGPSIFSSKEWPILNFSKIFWREIPRKNGLFIIICIKQFGKKHFSIWFLTHSASLAHLRVKTGMLRSRQWRFRESLESELEKRRVKTNIFPFHPKQKVNSLSWLASKNVNFGHGQTLNKAFFMVNLIKQSLRTYPPWLDGAWN